MNGSKTFLALPLFLAVSALLAPLSAGHAETPSAIALPDQPGPLAAAKAAGWACDAAAQPILTCHKGKLAALLPEGGGLAKELKRAGWTCNEKPDSLRFCAQAAPAPSPGGEGTAPPEILASDYSLGYCSVSLTAPQPLCPRGKAASGGAPGCEHADCTAAKANARTNLLSGIPATCGAYIDCGGPCKCIKK